MTTNDDIITDIATLKQQGIDTARQLESYHASINNYELMRRVEKTEMKEYVSDQIKIAIGDIKEHINKTTALTKIDIESSRKYCESENDIINKALTEVERKVDSFTNRAIGAIFVIGIIAWVIERFT